MLHGHIDIPTISFWEFGNIWTGSVYQTFNYRIAKKTEGERTELWCVIWYGLKCFELLTPEEYDCELHEEVTSEGLERTVDFINGKVDEYRKKLSNA
ncbi:MAG: hypothetical protein IKP95_11465 [Ruminococcus sp.]|nr:hypothetical protein [Ruminococcus sp.]